MLSASTPSVRRAGDQPQPGGGRVVHLHVVEAEVYADWESVYRDNVDRLYRLMYARVGNRADAEDLTAEVFRTALGPFAPSFIERGGALVSAAHGQDGAGFALAATPWQSGDVDRPGLRPGLFGGSVGT